MTAASDIRPLSLYASRVANNLVVALAAKFNVYVQLSLNLNGRRSLPILSAYPKRQFTPDWLNDRDELTDPPTLVIEVCSASESPETFMQAAAECLRAGVRSCWIVAPQSRRVIVVEDNNAREFAHGDLVDSSLDLALPLHEIFR
jgi:Uma2 family endonuclease